MTITLKFFAQFLFPLFFLFFEPTLAALSIFIISLVLYATNRVFLYYKLGGVLYWFIFLLLVIVPIFQLSTKSIAYIEIPSFNNSAYVYLAFYNTIFIIVFCFLTYINRLRIITRDINNYQPSNRGFLLKAKKPALCLSLISFIFFMYFLLVFGGISGLASSYNERLLSSVTEYNPLAGAGVLQAFANLFPVYVGVYFITITKLNASNARLLLILSITLCLSFIVSGIFGSRQGVLFAAFGVLWCWHFFIKNFTKKELVYFFAFACFFMLIAMPLKFFGFDFEFEMIYEFNDIRKIDVALGPLGFLIIRDFGRFDVNVFVMNEYLHNSFELGYGKTVIQGVFMAIPGGFFDNMLLTPTELKSNIFLGNYIHYGLDSTLLLGLPGEFLINFGFLGAVIFGFLIFILMFTIQYFLKNPYKTGSMIFIYSYLAPLVFLIFLFDSNVVSYYIVRWLVLFSIPMYFFTRKSFTL